MWLELEQGVSRDLRRRLRLDVANPHPDRPGRRALVLRAAHTVLPEAFVEDLPAIARAEVEAGLTGPLREAIATADPTEGAVGPLRDRLVKRLGGQPGLGGALLLADQVHLRRLVRGDMPAIVAVGCVRWYGAYRSLTDPQAQTVASLLGLEDAWLRSPPDRLRLEEAMRAEAVSLVGEDPEDLLDVSV